MKKEWIIAIVGCFCCLSVLAISADPAGRTAIYRSFELVPNEKLLINFEIAKGCSDPSKEKITIDDFESFKEYPSVDTGKYQQVRIKHYYIETFSPCENKVGGKYTKQITVGPFKDKMTHIKITTSDNVQIRTL